MSEMKCEYKKHTIKWEDWNRTFSISGPSEKRGFQTVEACEKWIDVQMKKKWNRVEVFAPLGWGGNRNLERGVATSMADDKHAWVTIKKTGERALHNIANVYSATPENEALIKQIAVLRDQMAEIDSSIGILLEGLTLLTPKMMEVEE